MSTHPYTLHASKGIGDFLKEYLRYLMLLFILLMGVHLKAQTSHTFKVLNAKTKKPIADIVLEILQNNDKRFDIGNTNKKGIWKTFIWRYDSTAKYDIYISDSRFKYLLQKVSLLDKRKTLILLYPDSTFIEKKPNLIFRECSYTMYGNYEPKEPHSLLEIPDSIRGILATHLISRLGENFYLRIKLNGGQIVDINRMHIVDPDTKHFEWIPYTYNLCFSFVDTSIGIGQFAAKIVLDKNGKVIDEIELPNIKTHPEKAKIIPLIEAKKIALDNNFNPEKSIISLDYDQHQESITWCFQRTINDTGLTFNIETLVIDAHSGEIIETKSGGGIR